MQECSARSGLSCQLKWLQTATALQVMLVSSGSLNRWQNLGQSHASSVSNMASRLSSSSNTIFASTADVNKGGYGLEICPSALQEQSRENRHMCIKCQDSGNFSVENAPIMDRLLDKGRSGIMFGSMVYPTPAIMDARRVRARSLADKPVSIMVLILVSTLFRRTRRAPCALRCCTCNKRFHHFNSNTLQ